MSDTITAYIPCPHGDHSVMPDQFYYAITCAGRDHDPFGVMQDHDGRREITLRLPEPHSIHSQSHLHGVLWELVEVTDAPTRMCCCEADGRHGHWAWARDE